MTREQAKPRVAWSTIASQQYEKSEFCSPLSLVYLRHHPFYNHTAPSQSLAHSAPPFLPPVACPSTSLTHASASPPRAVTTIVPATRRVGSRRHLMWQPRIRPQHTRSQDPISLNSCVEIAVLHTPARSFFGTAISNACSMRAQSRILLACPAMDTSLGAPLELWVSLSNRLITATLELGQASAEQDS